MKRVLALLALLGSTTACGPDYDHTVIDGVVTGTPRGSIDIARVIVAEGALVKAHIVSFDTDREKMPTDVRSADPATLQVSKVVSTDDYAFLGLKAGTTTVEIKAQGDTVLILEAIVTPQPAVP